MKIRANNEDFVKCEWTMPEKCRTFASFMKDSRVMWAVLRTELINSHSKKEYFTFVFADLISWRQCLIHRMLACIALHWSSQCHHSYWHMWVFVILKMHFQGQNNFNSIRSLVTVLLSFQIDSLIQPSNANNWSNCKLTHTRAHARI